MARVLVVCTGNICRSPIAEGLLRARFAERFGDRAPVVASAGTMGWDGSPAQPASVWAAAERGVDIAAHRARALDPREAGEADLVLAMAREHEQALATMAPGRAFTLKELVRLLEALEPVREGDPDSTLPERVRQADALRRGGFEGNPHDEDVVDPLGMPLESYRAVAWELEDWCGRLVDGLFGRRPAEVGGTVR